MRTRGRVDVLLFEPMRADQLRDFEGISTRVIDEWSSVGETLGDYPY